MLNCATLQKAYNDLYKQIRNYMWSFQAVEAIADLEIACYKACPDLDEVRRCLNRLLQYMRDVMNDDPDLEKAVNKFQDTLSDETETYMKLNKVNEVIQQ